MTKAQIASMIDHTLLKATATPEQIAALCDTAKALHTASVCVNPCHVALAARLLKDSGVKVCTVIGFPLGANTTAVKAFETKDAIANGADEVDMVINLGWVKDRRYDLVEEEIRQIHAACKGKLLKVIIETCLLTDEEKVELCHVVTRSGAEYIKTSTGFSKAGATFHDVELFAQHVGPHVKIKAAGGISSLEDAEKFIQLGASRLGTSRIVKLAKAMEA